MNFTNINPADRTKVFALIGGIALVLFLFIHTLIGALKPKKPAPTVVSQQQNASTVPAPPPPAQVATTQSVPANMSDLSAFPSTKAESISSKLHESDLGLDVHDPFKPLYGTGKDNQSQPAKPSTAPEVSVTPASSAGMTPLPAMGSGSVPPAALLNESGPTGKLSTVPITPPAPPEPSIKLVGIVQGDSSVATIQVNSQTINATPGRALAKGYRLICVGNDGVQIRHKSSILHLNVGDIINPPSGN